MRVPRTYVHPADAVGSTSAAFASLPAPAAHQASATWRLSSVGTLSVN